MWYKLVAAPLPRALYDMEKQVYESSPKHDACTVLIKGEASERFIIVETRSAEALLDF